MTRLIWTRVNVVVIFRQQVDIVEEIAVMIAPPARLCEADVQQHAAVEPARMRLNHKQYRKNKGMCLFVYHTVFFFFLFYAFAFYDFMCLCCIICTLVTY